MAICLVDTSLMVEFVDDSMLNPNPNPHQDRCATRVGAHAHVVLKAIEVLLQPVARPGVSKQHWLQFV